MCGRFSGLFTWANLHTLYSIHDQPVRTCRRATARNVTGVPPEALPNRASKCWMIRRTEGAK